ncbi:hypothetical protein [Streptomyces sp. NPDC059708]|uniref:hypothetical protein n=1 Tax=Streptomyces sp. NPDC059708 TaxID=3346916 RepID=UPI0036830387
MSTNYHAFGPFPGGDAAGQGLHIGQTAAGWRFLFRAHPEQGLTTLDDWLQLLGREEVCIRNEYGRDVSFGEMRQTMSEVTTSDSLPLRRRFHRDSEDHYVTSGGHAFSRRDFF